MSIVFLITDISLNRGGERMTSILANELITSNSVSIVSLYKDKETNFFPVNKKIKQVQINAIRNYISFNEKFVLKCAEIKKLSQLIKQSNGDIWIGVGTYCSFLLGLLGWLNKTNKYISWEHSNYLAASNKWKLLRKIFIKRMDAVVCLNKDDLFYYQKLVDKAIVIPNMVPFLVEKPALRNKNQILSIGALENEKGFDLLIKAYGKIASQTDWKLKIIGNGSLKIQLLALINAMNLNNSIEIVDATKEILNEYLEASFYVMSSHREGFPMVLLEALECGLPCVSFDCPTGPRYIIKDQINGLLVPEKNVDLLAGAMLQLINYQLLADRLAFEAKESAKCYHPTIILKSWHLLFNQLKE